MDVTILNEKTIKIKGKNASVVINPTSSTPKTDADAIIQLKESADFSDSKIEGSRISIKGPGEYEISGVKISTVRVNDDQIVRIDLDNVKVLVGNGASIEKIQDKIEESQVVVIDSTNEFNHSVLTSLEPSVLLVYGSRKTEVAKSLGKDEAVIASKYSTTSDKLPAEMEVVLLG